MTTTAEDPGRSLERFRKYLHLLARLQVDPQLGAAVDLSGVVQQTLMEAHQAWHRLRDWTAEQRAAWLRRALANNLADEVRKLVSARRDVRLTRSLDGELAASSARLEALLSEDGPSPLHAAIRQEQLLALAEALEQLAPDQRAAVELRHLRGLSVAEVAERMGRQKEAVAKLLFRGLAKLRRLLQDDSGERTP